MSVFSAYLLQGERLCTLAIASAPEEERAATGKAMKHLCGKHLTSLRQPVYALPHFLNNKPDDLALTAFQRARERKGERERFSSLSPLHRSVCLAPLSCATLEVRI